MFQYPYTLPRTVAGARHLDHPRHAAMKASKACSTTGRRHLHRGLSRSPRSPWSRHRRCCPIPVNSRQSEAHSAVGGALRHHRHQQRTGHRRCQHAGDHRSDPGEYRRCTWRRRRAIRWCSSTARTRQRADLQLRDACAVFDRRARAGRGPTRPCPTPMASIRRCGPCASRPAGVMSAAGAGNPIVHHPVPGADQLMPGPPRVAPDRSDFGPRAPKLGFDGSRRACQTADFGA